MPINVPFDKSRVLHWYQEYTNSFRSKTNIIVFKNLKVSKKERPPEFTPKRPCEREVRPTDRHNPPDIHFFSGTANAMSTKYGSAP